MPSSTPDPLPEVKRLRWALALERMSVGWNLLVGLVAVIVGMLASSLALLGLGADAIASTVGAAVVAGQFYVEGRKRPGHHGHKCPEWVTRLSGAFLILFCIWVAVASISNLLGSGSIPVASTFGIVIAGVSLASTLALSRAKLAFAAALASATLREEAWRTLASVWVSSITLLGLSANVALDWWWADPLAAFLLVPFLGMEGLQDLFGPLSPDITARR
jgi:divalent metal cation (Fe/Co/Zn/Cd) transporter